MATLKPFFFTAFYAAAFLLLLDIDSAHSTEITVSSLLVDKSLGFTVYLPVLECHAKYMGYKEVRWYKDYILVKKGGSALPDHILSLQTLLDVNSTQFQHPLKLQGYYWCETDFVTPSVYHNYLFRIEEVHTYVGRFISTQDSLGEDQHLPVDEKIREKKEIYEDELSETIFRFLPAPNTFVTDIKANKDGLIVGFYLYAHQSFTPRQPYDRQLVEDQHQLEYIFEYLKNETIVDEDLYRGIGNWLQFRGIKVEDIKLWSTMGCYEEELLIATDQPQVIKWPYARIGEIVIPEEACSAKNGLAVTRRCTGSFYSGAKWGMPSEKCEVPADDMTSALAELYDSFGDEQKFEYVKELKNLTSVPADLKVTDIHIVVEILNELSEAPDITKQEIDGILSIISSLVETNSSELIAAKSRILLTNRILEIVDNIMEVTTSKHKEIFIANQHILFETKDTKTPGDERHIIGFGVLSPSDVHNLSSTSIEFVYADDKKSSHQESMAYFLLPLDLVLQREADVAFPCQVEMVFFEDWRLFPHPKHLLVKRNYKVLPTPVMYVSLSGGPAWNLTDPVRLYFKNTAKFPVEDPVCVHYDPRLDNGDGGWSREGCKFGGLKDGFYSCECHHLSIFAVILSQNPEGVTKYMLGTAVYVGCAVSILALGFTVTIFLISKIWRSTVDHVILFCLALSFLCCLSLILFSDLWNKNCMVLALILQYTVFAIFGWLLVLAIIYQLRFAKKTDVAEIPHFTLKSSLSVWGVPIIIVIIIWLTKDYKHSEKDNCLSTVSDVSRVSIIPIVTLMLVTLCVNTCAVYALTCRHRKDFLIGESKYTESVIKFRVAFTIYLFFVASWLFGFFALHKRSQDLRILFAVSVTLTSYYVTLFFVFHEISFWEMCGKRKKKDAIPTQVVKYEAKQYEATNEGFTPG